MGAWIRAVSKKLADLELLTRAEAAELTRMSVRTIAYWMQQGKVDVVYTVSGRPRIRAASLWRSAPEPVEAPHQVQIGSRADAGRNLPRDVPHCSPS